MTTKVMVIELKLYQFTKDMSRFPCKSIPHKGYKDGHIANSFFECYCELFMLYQDFQIRRQ